MNDPFEARKALIHTTMGDITLQMYNDMPITAGNFQKLVAEGFYDDLTFHRVIKKFMIQGGCPKGTGTGGPGYAIKDEFVKGHPNFRGTMSMANSGPNTGGSQFFINLVDNLYLDWDNMQAPQAKHPVFGEVVEGMEIVAALGEVRTDSMDRPVTCVKIIKAELI